MLFADCPDSVVELARVAAGIVVAELVIQSAFAKENTTLRRGVCQFLYMHFYNFKEFYTLRKWVDPLLGKPMLGAALNGLTPGACVLVFYDEYVQTQENRNICGTTK